VNGPRTPGRVLSTVLLAIVAIGSSTGCLVLSVHPFYQTGSLGKDPALLGAWENPEQGISVVIAAGEWDSYRISVTDRSGTQHFTGYLTRLGSTELLDVLPAHGYERGEMFIPLHAALSVVVEGDTLTARALDYEWFAKELKRGKLRELNASFDAKQNVLLTAGTEALREFLTKQLRKDAASADVLAPVATLSRKK
jgi:hypothetical protein